MKNTIADHHRFQTHDKTIRQSLASRGKIIRAKVLLVGDRTNAITPQFCNEPIIKNNAI
ncbi:hypothetical protein T4D_5077 [Trichinella pseudospiralis]|uniref:Uncharacterized protein n=1 Tax=Trichinella pseudospiralis TaxID=6337 RepID=A0A0V1F2U9_TRIPS|nr:hypothetical protein T4D_5077 [Trichinella pseudospiralis]